MRKLSENNWFFICIAIAIMGLSLAVFGAIKASHSQDLSVEQFIDIASTAKVGDIIQKKDNIEIRKADNKGKLNARIYSEKQYDKDGNPVIYYDSSTKKVFSNGHYIKYIPDITTSKLTVTRIVSNNSIKEYTIVPSKDIAELRWTIETDLNYKITKDCIDFEGVFATAAPIVWDANKKPVMVSWSLDKDSLVYSLTYTVDTVFPVTVDPNTTITGTTFGRIYGYNATYSTARTTAIAVESDFGMVGQNISDYMINRSVVSFNLSSLPTPLTVSACSIYVKSGGDNSTTDFVIRVISSYQTGVDTGSYIKFWGYNASGAHTPTYLDNGGYNTSSGFVNGTWYNIPLGTTGVDSVKSYFAKGIIKMMLISSRDISNTTPSNREDINISGGANTPYLSINYTLPASVSARRFLYNNEPFYLWKNGNNIPLYKK